MLVKNAKFVFDPLDGKVKDCARKSKSLYISHAMSYLYVTEFENWASFWLAGQFRIYKKNCTFYSIWNIIFLRLINIGENVVLNI